MDDPTNLPEVERTLVAIGPSQRFAVATFPSFSKFATVIALLAVVGFFSIKLAVPFPVFGRAADSAIQFHQVVRQQLELLAERVLLGTVP